MHEASCFVTLTYNEDNVPLVRPDIGTLVPKHLQLWLKRFRQKISPSTVRYYAVGEYGDQTWRPHYHLALFGVGPEAQQIISDTWAMGFVQVGDLTRESAQYVAGYVTKKMTSKDDPRLSGRHPEFARMSNRPGIGAVAMKQVATALSTEHGLDECKKTGDVPFQLMHGKKNMPLGRYLRRKLREEMGLSEFAQEEIKRQNSFSQSLEMSALLRAALDDKTKQVSSLKNLLLELNEGKIRNIEARSKIFTQGRNL